jgi:hypothetical protein
MSSAGAGAGAGALSAPVREDSVAQLFDFLFVPFTVLHLPSAKLRFPSFTWKLAFGLFLASFLFVSAGVIYDLIVEPPAIGSELDPRTGAVRPVTFVKWRINGQFIIEGFAAAFFFGLGGLALIVLEGVSNNSSRAASLVARESKAARIRMAVGGVMLVLSFMALVMFIKVKLPSYAIFHEI